MATNNYSHFLLFLPCLVGFLSFNSKPCFGIRPRHFNLSSEASHWADAGATWYGSPDGYGSDGIT